MMWPAGTSLFLQVCKKELCWHRVSRHVIGQASLKKRTAAPSGTTVKEEATALSDRFFNIAEPHTRDLSSKHPAAPQN